MSKEAFLYRWASMAYRTDSPSVKELEADGWEVEHVDPRYGTRLMRKPTTPAPANRLAYDATALVIAILFLVALAFVGVRWVERTLAAPAYVASE